MARLLLVKALDDEPDGETVAEILRRIPGAMERIAEGRAQADRGEGIPLEDL